MKHLISCCIAILFFYSLSAQNNVSISFDKMNHKFGTILEKDGNVAYIFNYKNTGKQDVKIEELNASCGCTTVDWIKTPLAPNHTSSIKVVYNPADRPGSFLRYINVVFSTPYGLEVIPLSIEGYVQSIKETWAKAYPYTIGDLHFNAMKLVKNVYNKDTVIFKIPVYNAASKKHTIQVQNNKRYYLKPTVIQKFQQDTLQLISTCLANDWGDQKDTVFLRIDSTVYTSPIIINKHISENTNYLSHKQKLNAPILQSIGEINLGNIKINQIFKHKIFIKNIGINPLFIRKFEKSNNLLKIKCKRLKIKRNRKSKLEITLNTKGLSTGYYSTSIIIISNDLHNSERIIECKWTIVP